MNHNIKIFHRFFRVLGFFGMMLLGFRVQAQNVVDHYWSNARGPADGTACIPQGPGPDLKLAYSIDLYDPNNDYSLTGNFGYANNFVGTSGRQNAEGALIRADENSIYLKINHNYRCEDRLYYKLDPATGAIQWQVNKNWTEDLAASRSFQLYTTPQGVRSLHMTPFFSGWDTVNTSDLSTTNFLNISHSSIGSRILMGNWAWRDAGNHLAYGRFFYWNNAQSSYQQTTLGFSALVNQAWDDSKCVVFVAGGANFDQATYMVLSPNGSVLQSVTVGDVFCGKTYQTSVMGMAIKGNYIYAIEQSSDFVTYNLVRRDLNNGFAVSGPKIRLRSNSADMPRFCVDDQRVYVHWLNHLTAYSMDLSNILWDVPTPDANIYFIPGSGEFQVSYTPAKIIAQTVACDGTYLYHTAKDRLQVRLAQSGVLLFEHAFKDFPHKRRYNDSTSPITGSAGDIILMRDYVIVTPFDDGAYLWVFKTNPTVNTPPVLDDPDPMDVPVYVQSGTFARQMRVISGMGPYTWTIDPSTDATIRDSLMVSATGLVSGWIPTSADVGNTYTIAVKVTGANGSSTKSFRVHVQAMPYARTLMDFGATAATDVKELPEFNVVGLGDKLIRTGSGPAGIVRSTQLFNGSVWLKGSGRYFHAGDQIRLTLYNQGSATESVSPKISFITTNAFVVGSTANETSKNTTNMPKPVSAQYLPLGAFTIPAGQSKSITYTLRDTDKGGYNVVTATPWQTNGVYGAIIFDKIELISAWPFDQELPQSPTISLTSPAEGAVFSSTKDIAMTASANVSSLPVKKVVFYGDGVVLGTVTQAPYNFTWLNAPLGPHTLTVEVTDRYEIKSTSSPIHVSVIDVQTSAPSVTMTTPSEGSSFVAPASVTLTANATDSDGSIAKVEFYQGTTKIGESTSAPYGMAWDNVGEGAYSLTAIATDNQGATGTSSTVNITVNTAPSITTQPSNQTVVVGQTATFTVIANGTASLSYQWKKNGSDISGATSSSYTTPAVVIGDNGSTYSVMVSNVAGNVTSTAVTLTVNSANVSPTISITGPTDGTVYTAPANISITTSAADADGNLSKVEFYQGASKIGESTSAPYGFVWSGVSAGDYSLTAIATDSIGASAASSAINIRVARETDLTGAGLTGTSIGGGSGSARILADGTWEVHGTGIGMGVTDSLYFQQSTQTGDFEVVGRIQSLQGGTAPLAGIMIREGNNVGDRTVMIALGATTQYQTGIRIFKTGVGVVSTSSSSFAYPNGWAGITREGDVVVLYGSSDGVIWNEVRRVLIPGLAKDLNVGVFVTSGDGTSETVAVMSDYEVNSLNQLVVQPCLLTGGNTTSLVCNGNGALYSWGNNTLGQLGNGTSGVGTGILSPVQLASLNNAVSVSFGGEHALVIKSDGSVVVWGYNNRGQLGDNSTTNRTTPANMIGMSSNVVAVAGGGSHSLILKSDGSVWACGYNAYGQLGNGSITDAKVPVAVSGLNSGVIAIAAGKSHSVALKSDGTVWVWGLNNLKQLGNATTAGTSVIPLQVTGLTGIVSIASGGDHCLVVDSNGAVKGWGANSKGQLSVAGGNNISTPVSMSGMSSGVVAVRGGGTHSLILKNDGKLYACGNNVDGQLGDGTVTARTSPVLVGTGIVAMTGGTSHSMAVKQDGVLFAWGLNSSGQVGDGTTVSKSLSIQLSAPVINCFQ